MEPKIEGIKFDQEKPRMDLLDAYALIETAKVMTFGASKYEDHNWRKGMKYGRFIAALLRHIFAFMRGEDNDPETGLSHIAHAMCCCMFLLWTVKHRPDLDDRWKGTPQEKRESNKYYELMGDAPFIPSPGYTPGGHRHVPCK